MAAKQRFWQDSNPNSTTVKDGLLYLILLLVITFLLIMYLNPAPGHGMTTSFAVTACLVLTRMVLGVKP